jgi:hypothetical protein
MYLIVKHQSKYTCLFVHLYNQHIIHVFSSLLSFYEVIEQKRTPQVVEYPIAILHYYVQDNYCSQNQDEVDQ